MEEVGISTACDVELGLFFIPFEPVDLDRLPLPECDGLFVVSWHSKVGSMSAVSAERLGEVLVLRLDTGKVNVLSEGALRELRAHVEDAASSPDIRTLILLGREGAFCAGLDLAVLVAGGRPAQQLLVEMGELLVELYGSRLQVLAGCTGHAVAAGAMLLLVSDLRIGAEGEFRIGFSEVGRGLALPLLPVTLARDRISPRFLQMVTMTGRLLGPREAVEAGFLDRTVPADAVYDTALEEARALAKLSADAYAETLNNVRGPTLRKLELLLEAERRRLSSIP